MNIKKLFGWKNLSVGVKASIVYTLANVLASGFSIISTPVFTRLMSPSEIGIVATYTTWFTLVAVFANLSLNSGSFNIAMMEFKTERDQYISSVVVMSTLATVLTFVVYILFQNNINAIIDIPQPLIWIMFLSLLFLPATNFWMARQRYEYKYISVGVITFFTNILALFLGVVFVIIFSRYGKDLAFGRIAGTNILPICIAVFFYITLLYKGRTFYNKKYLLFVLTVNTPMMFQALSKQILDISDRIMISRLRGKYEVGIYGVLYTVSSFSLLVWNAINMSIVPYMFEKIGSIDGERRIRKLINSILVFYGCVCIGITLIAPEIVKVLATEEYYSAIYMMPPVAAGIFFTCLHNIYSNVLLYYKKTNIVMLATAFAAVVNIILNIIFIPRYGFVAAAYTTLVSFVVLGFSQFIAMTLIRKSKKLFNDFFMFAISFIIVGFCLLCNVLYPYLILRLIVIGASLLGILIFRERIKEMLTALLNR